MSDIWIPVADAAVIHEGPVATVLRTADHLAVVVLAMARVNTINLAFLDGFEAALAAIDDEEGLRGIVLTSGHRDFCVGADLNMILAADDAEANNLRRVAEVKIAAHGVSATYETVEQDGLENLCRAVSAREEGVLVMGGEQRVLQDGGVQDLLEHVGCSVLLVR